MNPARARSCVTQPIPHIFSAYMYLFCQRSRPLLPRRCCSRRPPGGLSSGRRRGNPAINFVTVTVVLFSLVTFNLRLLLLNLFYPVLRLLSPLLLRPLVDGLHVDLGLRYWNTWVSCKRPFGTHRIVIIILVLWRRSEAVAVARRPRVVAVDVAVEEVEVEGWDRVADWERR